MTITRGGREDCGRYRVLSAVVLVLEFCGTFAFISDRITGSGGGVRAHCFAKNFSTRENKRSRVTVRILFVEEEQRSGFIRGRRTLRLLERNRCAIRISQWSVKPVLKSNSCLRARYTAF
uniref:Uncharacterized protein n=1 Tax=Sipha flava TaxID=143950 RepID=A0A2S2PWV2_9HEMI